MATRKTPAAEPAGVPDPTPVDETPDFEVVGDYLVCHPYDDLRISLAVDFPTIDRWIEINSTSGTWREQIAAWQAEIIPADVLAKIREVAGGDGIREIELCRQWSNGLDVRLGKALS